MDGSLVIMEGSLLFKFCYINGWQPCHYGTQSIVEIFVIPMDGSLIFMEGSSLLRFCYSNGWQPCHYGRQFVVKILLLQWMLALSLWKVVRCCDFVTPLDASLVIMEGSLLSRFCYSNGWQPYHYGRQFVVEILLLQWMVALSLCKVVRC